MMGTIHEFLRVARNMAAKATDAPWAWEGTSRDAIDWSVGLLDPPMAGEVPESDVSTVADVHVCEGHSGNLADPEIIAFLRNHCGALLDVVDAASDVEAAFKRVGGTGAVFLECSGVEAERRINRLRDALAKLAEVTP